jgi:hypothetical protein
VPYVNFNNENYGVLARGRHGSKSCNITLNIQVEALESLMSHRRRGHGVSVGIQDTVRSAHMTLALESHRSNGTSGDTSNYGVVLSKGPASVFKHAVMKHSVTLQKSDDVDLKSS